MRRVYALLLPLVFVPAGGCKGKRDSLPEASLRRAVHKIEGWEGTNRFAVKRLPGGVVEVSREGKRMHLLHNGMEYLKFDARRSFLRCKGLRLGRVAARVGARQIAKGDSDLLYELRIPCVNAGRTASRGRIVATLEGGEVVDFRPRGREEITVFRAPSFAGRRRNFPVRPNTTGKRDRVEVRLAPWPTGKQIAFGVVLRRSGVTPLRVYLRLEMGGRSAPHRFKTTRFAAPDEAGKLAYVLMDE